jgi:glutamyl-tRNA reductase
MRVGVVGINHKSADLCLRELVAKACDQRFGAGSSTHGRHCFILLSTCNRTEVYFSSEDLTDTHSYLLRVLRNDVQMPFEHKLYSYFGYDCFTHLAHVTAGLDSAIIGETEIQGQVKQAYESAAVFSRLPSNLHFMFQKGLKIGKQIRSNFQLHSSMPSLSSVILQTGGTFFPDFQNRRVLFVGASKVNEKILRHLKSRGVENLTLCNRSHNNAEIVGKQENVKILEWSSLHLCNEYDLVIFGTKAPGVLLTKKDVHLPSGSRKLIIDLSVPRNVEVEIGKISGITLLNIDQIDGIVEKKRKIKTRELDDVEKMLSEAIHKQVMIFTEKEKQRYCLLATAGA